VQRRIFGPKREKVAGGWRNLHSEKLHNVYASPNIVRVIKSVIMRCVRRVPCMSEMKNACEVLFGKLEGKRPVE
jgi:hypothetical protein